MTIMSTPSTININDTEINTILHKIGLTGTKLADTLQGSIWRVLRQTNSSTQSETAILKVTSRHQHQQSIAIVNGKQYTVDENIMNEQSILKYLTNQSDCPDTIVKYQWFFKDEKHLFFLMTDGGNCLFDFVSKSHSLIRQGILEPTHWKKVTKVIFKQMVNAIDYIHSKQISHFDISLENFLINDVNVRVDIPETGTAKMRFNLNDIKIKLCDFGLSEIFGTDYSSNKFSGKKQYMSPELVSKKTFNAVKNDIWCLGISLFLLNIGAVPWEYASQKSKKYNYVMSHSVGDLLKYWKVGDLYDEDLVFCLNGMIKDEGNRINLKDIKQYIQQHM